MSISGMTISTWTPSQHACRAQKGPHSANGIRPPDPRRAEAQSSPYPHTDTHFPRNLVSVARVMPSLGEGAKMSNSDMTTQTPVKYQQLPRQPAQRRVAARRQGPRVPSPSHTGVFGPPPFCAPPTLFREFSFFWQLGRFLFPGVLSQSPLTPVLGSPPFRLVHHCTGQEATDPQFPKGGSQRACPPGVPTPRLLGDTKEWRCLSSGPCFGS